MWEYPNRPAGECPHSFSAILWLGFDRSQPEKKPFLQKKHSPQEIVNGTTTLSPTLSFLLSAPTSTTSPIVSWPRTSPFSIDGITPSNRWRSEPQMAQAVTLMMASRPSWIVGSGTVSQRMSFLPCQVSAFIGFLHRNVGDTNAGRRFRSCCGGDAKGHEFVRGIGSLT